MGGAYFKTRTPGCAHNFLAQQLLSCLHILLITVVLIKHGGWVNTRPTSDCVGKLQRLCINNSSFSASFFCD